VTAPPPFAAGAHAADVTISPGGAPKTRIRLLPMGTIVTRDGRGPYRLDDLAHAQAVVTASLAGAGSTQIPIDYDHQIPFGARDGVGGQAPASGWITALSAEADGVWASVEWTNAATAKIKAREYRYISPFFSFEKDTGRVTRIWNAALVNLSNFTELSAVAGATPWVDSTLTPDEKRICALVGVSEAAFIVARACYGEGR
jgi:phage I-like protein